MNIVKLLTRATGHAYPRIFRNARGINFDTPVHHKLAHEAYAAMLVWLESGGEILDDITRAYCERYLKEIGYQYELFLPPRVAEREAAGEPSALLEAHL